MLALRDALALMNDGFYRCTHAKPEFIHHRYESVYHIGSNKGVELDIESLLQFFTDF
jgi:hypothetical protein